PAVIDQIPATRPDRVTSGVANTVRPSRSKIGFNAEVTSPRNQLLIAYRICPGISNRPGFFSNPPSPAPGPPPGPGPGFGPDGSPGSITTGPDGTTPDPPGEPGEPPGPGAPGGPDGPGGAVAVGGRSNVGGPAGGTAGPG